ncbi:methylated-DNA--[protein]-cysteine S-methyltransferase [Actinoallomurus sp. CA-150999]|uniref:methylated-DNA--[protein]-cysteine S-methyltransferase n=1 Tax=Actinoallomurus sp. CA-150999 TaxID=3239887 RepID=UPI003D8A9318
MHVDRSLAWVTVRTPLPTGDLRVAVTDRGVVAAGYTAEGVAGLPAGPEVPSDDRRAAAVVNRITEYFAGRRRELDLPIDWRSTSGIQSAVLRTLQQTVGYGETITYGVLAERSGVFEEDPGEPGYAARTVGTIMSTNPISLLVPCHRVVAADGLGGFGSVGLDVKRWLLTLEGVLPPTLDWTGPG